MYTSFIFNLSNITEEQVDKIIFTYLCEDNKSLEEPFDSGNLVRIRIGFGWKKDSSESIVIILFEHSDKFQPDIKYGLELLRNVHILEEKHVRRKIETKTTLLFENIPDVNDYSVSTNLVDDNDMAKYIIDNNYDNFYIHSGNTSENGRYSGN